MTENERKLKLRGDVVIEMVRGMQVRLRAMADDMKLTVDQMDAFDESAGLRTTAQRNVDVYAAMRAGNEAWANLTDAELAAILQRGGG